MTFEFTKPVPVRRRDAIETDMDRIVAVVGSFGAHPDVVSSRCPNVDSVFEMRTRVDVVRVDVGAAIRLRPNRFASRIVRLRDHVPVVAGPRLRRVEVFRFNGDHFTEPGRLHKGFATSYDLSERPLVRKDVSNDLFAQGSERCNDAAVARPKVGAFCGIRSKIEQRNRRDRGTAGIDVQFPVTTANGAELYQREVGLIETEDGLTRQARHLAGQERPNVDTIDRAVRRYRYTDQSGQGGQEVSS